MTKKRYSTPAITAAFRFFPERELFMRKIDEIVPEIKIYPVNEKDTE